jgi:hypothetical protein
MFTRLVELKAKPGKAQEVTKTIQEKILPILRGQAGFVDEIVLVSEIGADHVVALSFWTRQEDAERYSHEQYPKVNEIISNLVESGPVVRSFYVDSSTIHKIVAGKAA